MTDDEFEKCYEAVEGYCKKEFGQSTGEPDQYGYGIGYTETGDGEHSIQFYADIDQLLVSCLLDNRLLFAIKKYESAGEFRLFMGMATFDNFVGVADQAYKKLTDDCKNSQEIPLIKLVKAIIETADGYWWG